MRKPSTDDGPLACGRLPPGPDDVLRPGLQRWLLLAATLVLAGFLATDLWLTEGRLAFPLDDPFIHLRIADNLAQGDGFAFNPGEPLPASTSPLWVLLLALASWVGANSMVAALVLSALSFVATGWAAARLAQRLSRRSEVALLAGLATLLAGRLGWASLAGMETLAFTAVSLLAIDASIAWARTPSPTRRGQAWLGALYGLAALLRPEGVLLFAVFLAHSTLPALPFARERQARAFRLPPLWALLSFSLLLGPWVAFCLATTGAPFPTTVGAKMAFLAHDSIGLFLLNYAKQLFESNPLLALSWPFGAVLCARAMSRDSGARLVLSWALCLPAAAAVLLPVSEYHHGRYLMPSIPFAMVLGAMGAVWLFDKLPVSAVRRASAARIALAAVLAAAGLYGARFALILGSNAAEIFELQMQLGFWAQQHTAPGATLAACDIGALAFLGKRRVFDLAGIATPEVAPLLRGRRLGGGQDEVLWPLLVRERPAYLVVYPDWYPHLTARPDLFEPVQARTVDAQTIAGGRLLVAYQAHWEGYLAAPALDAEVARAQVERGRALARQGHADAAWSALAGLEAAGPLHRGFRRLLYVARAEVSLARGDCALARRSLLQLDWLAPPAAMRAREGLEALTLAARQCSPRR